MHAYTGCDSTNAFMRKEKVAALKMLQEGRVSGVIHGAWNIRAHY